MFNVFIYFSSAVAKYISNDCFALVFGFNTFLALALQSTLTAFVVSEWLFVLNATQQYLVYCGYFAVLAAVYGIMAVIKIFITIAKN